MLRPSTTLLITHAAKRFRENQMSTIDGLNCSGSTGETLMSISSIGETLRRERLRKAMSLEQISSETKISLRMLDAIETDQFDLFSASVFAKNFVRQYARFMGLDEDELAARVDKVIQPVMYLPDIADSSPEPALKGPRAAERLSRIHSNSSALSALAMVVVATLMASAVYAWWQRGRGPAIPFPPAASSQTAPEPARAKPPEPDPVKPTVENSVGIKAKTDAAPSGPTLETAASPVDAGPPAAPVQATAPRALTPIGRHYGKRRAATKHRRAKGSPAATHRVNPSDTRTE
jgi:cytoskeleton protein RodZ